MAVKKSELYSSLWASCDKLRGGMDASQYKDYVLTLLFIKYVSDKFKDEPYGAIVIPEKSSFEDLVAHFNDEAKLGKGQEMVDKLTDLIAIFQRPELNFKNNKAEDDDLIGDAYEFLMRKFATVSGKSKGQFYTPAEVSRILAKVIDVAGCKNKNATIYDPACGSGSLLIRAAKEAPFPLAIYGQEKDGSTAGLAKMNLVLHNKAEGETAADNTFSNPFYRNDTDDGQLRQFDYVVANPPFSMKNWKDGLKEFGRFDDYDDRPPEKNGDYGTGIPTCIIVLDKEHAADRTGIFMIDASRGFMKDKDKNRLREQDIYKIVTAFSSMHEIKGR